MSKHFYFHYMDCTLVFVAIDKRNNCAFIGTLGDSAVCVIGRDQSAVYTDSSVSANGTFTVMGSKAVEQLKISKVDLTEGKIIGFILTSDGLENEIFTKGSQRVQKAAEFYLNSLVEGSNSDHAYQYISQRIEKLTTPKDSSFDDDISLSILSCADMPISLPVDPTWLCICGNRNTLQNTYCKQCKADFIKIYSNIKFREYGGKAAYFTRLNSNPQEEAEIVAAAKAGIIAVTPSQGIKKEIKPPIQKKETPPIGIPKTGYSTEGGTAIPARQVIPTTHATPTTQVVSSKQTAYSANSANLPVVNNQIDRKPNDNYQQGYTDGFRKGRIQGYNEGKQDGYNLGVNSGVHQTPWYIKKAPLIGSIVAATFLIIVVTSSMLSNNAGYKKGFVAGEESGRATTVNELETDYDNRVQQLQIDYDGRLGEQYQLGYVQGKADAEAAKPTYTPVPITAPAEGVEAYIFKKGSHGSEVKVIQQQLLTKGWIIDVDGKYGKATVQAVKDFQTLNKLPVTGEVDILTYWALLSDESIGNFPVVTETPSSAPSESPAPTVARDLMYEESNTALDTDFDYNTAPPKLTLGEITSTECPNNTPVPTVNPNEDAQ